MKQKITNLRIKIDGLSQLVKGLQGYSVDLAYKNDDEEVNDFIKRMKDEGKGMKYPLTSELQKSYDSLILAKAWLGKVLGELGQETPYKNDGNRKTVEDIEKTADSIPVNEYTIYKKGIDERDYVDFNHIEKVDWIRQEIKLLINIIEELSTELPHNREIAIARTNCYNHLSETRFWLGFELQRIKENG